MTLNHYKTHYLERWETLKLKFLCWRILHDLKGAEARFVEGDDEENDEECWHTNEEKGRCAIINPTMGQNKLMAYRHMANTHRLVVIHMDTHTRQQVTKRCCLIHSCPIYSPCSNIGNYGK